MRVCEHDCHITRILIDYQMRVLIGWCINILFLSLFNKGTFYVLYTLVGHKGVFGVCSSYGCLEHIIFLLCSPSLPTTKQPLYLLRCWWQIICGFVFLFKILLLSMKDMNIAKLTSQDLPLFNGIVSDLFPGVETPTIDYGKVQTAILFSCWFCLFYYFYYTVYEGHLFTQHKLYYSAVQFLFSVLSVLSSVIRR